MLFKSVLRRIKSSLGRYLAIFGIIALGVGFFAGLRVTPDSMLKTADGYIDELKLYDFRLVSTLGFTESDVAAFSDDDGIKGAYGSVNADFLVKNDNGSNTVFRAHMILEGCNECDLVSGRMPEKSDECVLDGKFYDDSWIGKTLTLSPDNSEDTFDKFVHDSYTVTGIVHSIYYINFERGSSALGSGSVSGYIYIPSGGFEFKDTNGDPYYTEIFLRLNGNYRIYSDEYKEITGKYSEILETKVQKLADARYDTIISDAQAELDGYRRELEDGETEYSSQKEQFERFKNILPAEKVAEYESQLEEAGQKLEESRQQIAEAEEEIAKIERPKTYVLDRTTNPGYACLENDTSIVTGVSKVFPLFFFAVAALVCTTTMTRMVEELRVENGVLKALGYGNGAIAGQYIFYAGSASLLGCIAGFIVGSKLMPMALWMVYNIMYSISRPVAFVLDWKLFAVCTVLYMFCSLGATWLVCRRMLGEQPAELIRPKSPAAGKRIFLERIGFIWKRMKFLHKVSARNILRYKKRMFMMIIGIGGCTALLITGFGISDSIKPILDFQYAEIQTYDAAVTFMNPPSADEMRNFEELFGDISESVTFMYTGNIDVAGSKTETANFIVFSGTPDRCYSLHNGKSAVKWPGYGECIIDFRLARSQKLSVGDKITLTDSDFNTMEYTVSGIFDNYIGDFIFVSEDSVKSQLGSAPEPQTAFMCFTDGTDVHEAGARIMNESNIASVNLSEDMRTRIGSMLESLDYIVLIVLVCAGALAFIVLFNLSNISITERAREIATLKVLGFYKNETAAYVFRENLVLTGISAVCGIPMGILLLRYVMDQIRIKSMYFGWRLSPLSLVISVLLTFVFAVAAELFLAGKLEKINMAESLKAIE